MYLASRSGLGTLLCCAPIMNGSTRTNADNTIDTQRFLIQEILLLTREIMLTDRLRSSSMGQLLICRLTGQVAASTLPPVRSSGMPRFKGGATSLSPNIPLQSLHPFLQQPATLPP